MLSWGHIRTGFCLWEIVWLWSQDFLKVSPSFYHFVKLGFVIWIVLFHWSVSRGATQLRWALFYWFVSCQLYLSQVTVVRCVSFLGHIDLWGRRVQVQTWMISFSLRAQLRQIYRRLIFQSSWALRLSYFVQSLQTLLMYRNLSELSTLLPQNLRERLFKSGNFPLNLIQRHLTQRILKIPFCLSPWKRLPWWCQHLGTPLTMLQIPWDFV